MILSKKVRFISLVAAVAVSALALSSCSKNKENGDNSHKGDESKTSYTLSIGIELSTDSTSKGKAQVDATFAAVILDKDMRILDCYIDCAQNKMSLDDGTVETGGEYKTKMERGDEYGMEDASPIGEEWDDQAEFFADYVKGMNADEVNAIAIGNGGAAEDADLKAGCTIDVTDMKKALVKAVSDKKGAAVFTSDTAPELKVAAITYDTSSKSATENSGGAAAMYTDFCAAAVTNGRIDGAVIDTVEPKITFDKTGAIEDITYSGTKQEQGKDYGMSGVSGIGKEWYEQAAAFCDYIKGMTADEVAAIGTGDDGKPTDADLKAGCTVSVDSYIKTVTKALR